MATAAELVQAYQDAITEIRTCRQQSIVWCSRAAASTDDNRTLDCYDNAMYWGLLAREKFDDLLADIDAKGGGHGVASIPFSRVRERVIAKFKRLAGLQGV